MLSTLVNVTRIAELRNKILFTIGLLIVYRIGFYVPIPGVNGAALTEHMQGAGGKTALGTLANYLSVFSGGSLGRSTVFGLGIMPYISASIILQLLATVLPTLEKLKKEGEPGMRKINEWTRYLTVAICIIQGGWWIITLANTRGGDANSLLVHRHVLENNYLLFIVMGVVVLTAGSCFLMWLGEQIDQYGIGNGISLIITAGIVSRMPDAILRLYAQSPFGPPDEHHSGVIEGTFYGLTHFDFPAIKDAWGSIAKHTTNAHYGFGTLFFIMAAFVFVVAGSIFLTQAQRRIRIQQAKHMRGRRVYGGQTQYLPLRVNHAGVMPIIFASSLMIFPSMLTTWLADHWRNGFTTFLNNSFGNAGYGQFPYEMLYVGMIFFFAYFWNTVQFNPKEISNQLRDYGSFIPGLRPGKRTADYLEAVMMRITYVGSGFLAVIAVIPTLVATKMLYADNESFTISQFLGGTGLLIVISVMLDLVNRIEANLVMRDYGGFLEDSRASGPGRTKKSRGSTGSAPGAPKGLPT